MMAFLLTCLGIIIATAMAACWIACRETEAEKARKSRVLRLALLQAAGCYTPPWHRHPRDRAQAEREYHDFIEGRRP